MRRDMLLAGFAFIGLLALVAACGGSVVEGTPPGEEGGAGGSVPGAGGSQAGSGGSHAGSGGTGGWAGGAGTAGAGNSAGSPIDAGPNQCQQTHDQFSVKANLYTGQLLGCGLGMSQGVQEFHGVVTNGGLNSFELDSCPPNADCMQMLSRFDFDAPGLQVWFPEGEFVKVKILVNQPWGCEQQVEVTSLPEWGGVKNPNGWRETIYLSASDGLASAVPGSSIAVGKVALGCTNGDPPGCGGDPPDMYGLSFWGIQGANPVPVVVGMGSTATWTLPDANGDQFLMSRNLRSYSSGACDDYWNWGFWATQVMYDGL